MNDHTPANDPVSHPPHYTQHPSGVECITITEHMGFCIGNAIKYLWRADLKNDAIEDLRKAEWYVRREIERRLAAVPVTPEPVPVPAPRDEVAYLHGIEDGASGVPVTKPPYFFTDQIESWKAGHAVGLSRRPPTAPGHAQ